MKLLRHQGGQLVPRGVQRSPIRLERRTSRRRGCVRPRTHGGGVTRHWLVTELPAGWQPRARPDDWYGWGWQSPWGPEFRGDRAFRLWLPDGSPVDLGLPLGETVTVGPISPMWTGGRGPA